MIGIDTTFWGPDCIQPEQKRVLLGRASDVPLQLGHPAVSRRHAELRFSDGMFIVRDLGSRAGTRVNGRLITEQALQEGDRVQFGPVSYELREGRLHRLQTTEGVRLEARGLAIDREKRRLLTGVHLAFAPNQFIGLLGPSGSGKTSLMKCLAGYLLPTAGQLNFDGVGLAANLDSYRLQVGYVPQEDVLYPALTGRENLDFALRPAHRRPSACGTRENRCQDA